MRLINTLFFPALWHYCLGQDAPPSFEAPAATEVPASTERVVEGVDSDYLFLYMAQSTIPIDVGLGVFAKVDIPAGEIICEYRGPMILIDIPYVNNKKFRASTREGVQYSIIGDTICAMLNDPVHVVGSSYSAEDILSFKTSPREDIIPTYPGLDYNANFVATQMGKIFIYATVLIPAHTEIFFPYGK
jgi:hypothetical protein